MAEKIGRNDPCPCGSGKKYKKCCEQKLGSKKSLENRVISSGGLEGKASKISTNFFNQPPPPKMPAPRPDTGETHHPPEAEKPM